MQGNPQGPAGQSACLPSLYQLLRPEYEVCVWEGPIRVLRPSTHTLAAEPWSPSPSKARS